MAYGLPAIGEANWGQKILDSFAAVKTTADAAQAAATLEAAIAAKVGSSGALDTALDARYNALTLFNVKDYGAVGDGTTNDTLAFRAAITAVTTARASSLVKNKPAGILIPHGTFRIEVNGSGSAAGTDSGSTTKFAVVVPSDFVVAGAGPTSIVKMTGVPATAYGNPNHNSALGVLDGSSNIVFRDFVVQGENGTDATGFTAVNNNDSAAIDIVLSSTKDVLVERVTFKNLYGFSVHDRGQNSRVHVRNCVTRYCANGINANSDYAQITGNVIVNSEGIEASGSYADISHNTIKDGLGGSAISAGGNFTTNAETPGIRVSSNIIDGAAGIGISGADAFCYGSIVGNNIRKTGKAGIQVERSGAGHVCHSNLIANNVVVSAGLTTSSSSERVGIYLGGSGPHRAIGNTTLDGAIAGYGQLYGIYVVISGSNLSGNRFRGTSYDVKMEFATGVRLDASNDYTTLNLSSGAALASITTETDFVHKGIQTFRHHLVMSNNVGANNPSVTVKAAASAASRYSAGNLTSNDMVGIVQFTGNGTVGELFTLSYSRAWVNLPMVFLSFNTSASATAGLYISDRDTAGFTVSCTTGLTGTHFLMYFVVGSSAD